MNQHRQPLVAIVDNNMFAALGLKGILQSVMPIMQVETFLSFEELSHADPERFYHYFVAVNLVLNPRSFFIEHKRKPIVLTTSSTPNAQPPHRRNILEKLNIKSVSALTIYAVTHGYVDIHSI